MKELIAICDRFGIEDLYLFGSRAQEMAARLRNVRVSSNAPASDLDIGVMPRAGDLWGPDKRVRAAMALEDLFDVGSVDLVLLPEADPYLALDIIRGELLYTRAPDRQARYELYVLRRAADLLPFKKERTRMILEEGAR
jgi:hypothetical protein